MTNTTKHTPTPWHTAEEWSNQYDAAVIAGGPNSFVLAGAFYMGGTDQAKANAAHIVRCVNAHEALVAACKDCLEGRGDWVAAMTSALSKAESV